MNNSDTAAALASALPAGIRYDGFTTALVWRAKEIAAFQAERLAEAGYTLARAEVIEVPHEHEWIDVTQLSDPQNERRYVCNGCPDQRTVTEVQS